MKNTKLKIIFWFGISFLCFLFLAISVVRHDGKRIFLFNLDFTDGNQDILFQGLVIGQYTLESEFGEIFLNNWARVLAYERGWGGLTGISLNVFKDGRASHNLVVNGNKLPEIIGIGFDSAYQISSIFFDLRFLMNISGIPIEVNRIKFCSSVIRNSGVDRTNVNRVYTGVVLPEIILTDSTHIVKNLPHMHWHLFLYDDYEKWELYARNHNPCPPWRIGMRLRGNAEHYFLVKHPDEDEIRRYVSITFNRDWGEFMKGVLVEENNGL